MMGAAMLKRHQFVRSLWALYRLVVSSITWGSQAQPLYVLKKCFFQIGRLRNLADKWPTVRAKAKIINKLKSLA